MIRSLRYTRLYFSEMTWKELFCYWLDWAVDIWWRVAEIHVRKVMAFALFLLAIYDVSVIIVLRFVRLY